MSKFEDMELPIAEVALRKCSTKSVFLKISQSLQENAFAGVTF